MTPRIVEANGASDQHGHQSSNRPPGAAMALAMQAQKSRKRKGSLRKTALLGTGKMKLDEKASSLKATAQAGAPRSSPTSSPTTESDHDGSTDSETTARQRASFDDDDNAMQTSDAARKDVWPLRTGGEPRTSVDEDQTSPVSAVTSPSNSPRYTSTTDDDDGLTFTVATTASNELMRRRGSRSTHPKVTILQHPAPNPPIAARGAPADKEHSTTAFWGWVILVVTWVVFVVGMGSCLGVWSWAWDVGETPYAPPELEDDPTLPIVGYYPALIVMTAVMAWVWVVVAWVGMKYFRHARYGEE